MSAFGVKADIALTRWNVRLWPLAAQLVGCYVALEIHCWVGHVGAKSARTYFCKRVTFVTLECKVGWHVPTSFGANAHGSMCRPS